MILPFNNVCVSPHFHTIFCRFADTVLLAVKELAAQTSEENAVQLFKAANLDLLKSINAPPKQVKCGSFACLRLNVCWLMFTKFTQIHAMQLDT